MSDQDPKRDEATAPASLESYVGVQRRPTGKVLDSGEVRAAFSDVDAVLEAWKQEEQLRGIGNAQQYVAPTAVPAARAPSSSASDPAKVALRLAEVPAAKALSPSASDPAKVAFGPVDVPRALPAGVRTDPTAEIRFRTPESRDKKQKPDDVDLIATRLGNRWARSASRHPEPVELPSAHGPHATLAPAEVEDAHGRATRRWSALALGGLVVVVGVALLVRAGTTGPQRTEEPATSAIAAATEVPVPTGEAAPATAGRVPSPATADSPKPSATAVVDATQPSSRKAVEHSKPQASAADRATTSRPTNPTTPPPERAQPLKFFGEP